MTVTARVSCKSRVLRSAARTAISVRSFSLPDGDNPRGYILYETAAPPDGSMLSSWFYYTHRQNRLHYPALDGYEAYCRYGMLPKGGFCTFDCALQFYHLRIQEIINETHSRIRRSLHKKSPPRFTRRGFSSGMYSHYVRNHRRTSCRVSSTWRRPDISGSIR